jgi:hypothetical protein
MFLYFARAFDVGILARAEHAQIGYNRPAYHRK